NKVFTTTQLTKLVKELNTLKGLISVVGRYQEPDFNIDIYDLKETDNYRGFDDIETVNTVFSISNNEFELAKVLHENLLITRQQAGDNLFWTYLNHTIFYNYLKKQIPNDLSLENKALFIRNNFLIMSPIQGQLIKSPTAGLWWAIELTKMDP